MLIIWDMGELKWNWFDKWRKCYDLYEVYKIVKELSK